MPPPPSGGKGVPGQQGKTTGATPAPSRVAPPSSTHTKLSNSPPPLVAPNTAATTRPTKAPTTAAASVPTSTTTVNSTLGSKKAAIPPSAESLANIDPEKKIAVLKKAILSLTKQKQDLEMTKNSLEQKVTSLATQLATSEEKSSRLEHQNEELVQQIESYASAARGAGRFTAKAGSIFKAFSGGATDGGGGGATSISSPTSEDQQRLFEENEALHIQLFEQRQQFDKKYKGLETEKGELAMQLHALEGVVSSFQASDVAQSQQAEEAFKELQIERAYSKRCIDMILSNKSENEEDAAANALLGRKMQMAVADGGDDDSIQSSLPTNSVKRVLQIYTESIGDVLAGVSALLPHIPTNPAIFGVRSQSLEGERKKGLFTKQQKERLQALAVSHRSHRQRIQVELGKVGDSLNDDNDDGVTSTTTSESHHHNNNILLASIGALFKSVKEWLLFIHCNANLILGPLDSLRQKRASGGNSSSHHHHQAPAVTTLTSMLQQVVAIFIGEMSVVLDCIESSLSSSGGKGGACVSIIFALLAYREFTNNNNAKPQDSSSSSHNSNKAAASSMMFERMSYDVLRALEQSGGGGGDGQADLEVLNRHYITCMEQLMHTLSRGRKQLASAVGLGTHVTSITARLTASSHINSTNTTMSSTMVKRRNNETSESHDGLATHTDPVALLQAMLGGGGVEGGNRAISLEAAQGLKAAGSAADVWDLIKSGDANARHHIANFQHAMTELARMHDLVDSLTQQSGSLLKDKEHMKSEYVSVVQVYESQIAMLSDRLAELTS